jgi:cell division protein FtsB
MARKLWHRIPKWVYNRYLLVGVVFVVWMLFLDDNSFLFHKKLDRELNELEEAEEYYLEEIENDQALIIELDSNPEALEGIAREEYHMKKDKEDVYIIKEQKDE